ncbi:hypothetical protein ACOSQ4_013252 [Xanthoceras sorbifolium]
MGSLLQDFLTKGLSRHIKQDYEVELHHFLFCYSLMSACLAHKDFLESKRSEAEKIRLREELETVRKEAQAYKEELAAIMEFKKELADKANIC